MNNKAMMKKLENGEAIDVRKIGAEVREGVFELREFREGYDYCDAVTEQWIWSVGKEEATGKIFAATYAADQYYQRDGYECLWLR